MPSRLGYGPACTVVWGCRQQLRLPDFFAVNLCLATSVMAQSTNWREPLEFHSFYKSVLCCIYRKLLQGLCLLRLFRSNALRVHTLRKIQICMLGKFSATTYLRLNHDYRVTNRAPARMSLPNVSSKVHHNCVQGIAPETN